MRENSNSKQAARVCGASKPQPDQNGVDPQALDQLRLLNRPEEPDFFESIILLFLAEFDKWEPVLAHAVKHEDWPQLIKAAHEIGGTAMQCGAGHLAQLCRQVQSISEKDFSEARQVSSQLLTEVEQVRTILNREIEHK